jgi:hypothetical protein
MGNIGSCVSKPEKNKVDKKSVVLQDNDEKQISCELHDYNDKIKDLANKLNTVRQNYDERITETVYKMNNLEKIINNMATGENSKIIILEQDNNNDKINSLKKDYDDKIELLNAELNYLKICHDIKIEKIEENFSNLENECNKNTEGLEKISDEINTTDTYILNTNVDKIDIIDSLGNINSLEKIDSLSCFLEPLYLSINKGIAHLYGSIYSDTEYALPSNLKILDRVLYIQTNLSYSSSKHSCVLFLENNKIKFTNCIDISDDVTETKTFRRYNKNSKFNKLSTINIHFKL